MDLEKKLRILLEIFRDAEEEAKRKAAEKTSQGNVYSYEKGLETAYGNVTYMLELELNGKL